MKVVKFIVGEITNTINQAHLKHHKDLKTSNKKPTDINAYKLTKFRIIRKL